MTDALKNHEPFEPAPPPAGRRSIIRNPGILVADDVAVILTVLKFALEPRGFNVWLAVDGNDALDLYQRHRDQIDLVLLDVQMPGLDGPQTLAHLQRLDPDIVACFMTAYSGSYTEESLLNRGATCVFSKPFRVAQVADVLQKLALAAGFAPFVRDRQTAAEPALVCGRLP